MRPGQVARPVEAGSCASRNGNRNPIDFLEVAQGRHADAGTGLLAALRAGVNAPSQVCAGANVAGALQAMPAYRPEMIAVVVSSAFTSTTS
jgi:hypothetical protein